mgnify:FL=1
MPAESEAGLNNDFAQQAQNQFSGISMPIFKNWREHIRQSYALSDYLYIRGKEKSYFYYLFYKKSYIAKSSVISINIEVSNFL